MRNVERGDLRLRRTHVAAARLRRRSRAVAALAVASIVVGACAEPVAPEPVPTDDSDEPIESEVLDPAADELAAALAAVRDGILAARDELTVAATADSASDARAGAERALALLLDDPSRTTGPAVDGVRPLFPAATAERGSPEQQDDALSSTVSLARDAGGDTGRAAVETLRDPIAGDLGAWERDAEGVVARARDATDVSGGLAAQLETVSEQVALLDADGLRALAWTLAAVDARDLEDVQLAAERASAHLGVVVVALDLLLAPPADAVDAGDDDPDDEATGQQGVA